MTEASRRLASLSIRLPLAAALLAMTLALPGCQGEGGSEPPSASQTPGPQPRPGRGPADAEITRRSVSAAEPSAPRTPGIGEPPLVPALDEPGAANPPRLRRPRGPMSLGAGAFVADGEPQAILPRESNFGGATLAPESTREYLASSPLAQDLGSRPTRREMATMWPKEPRQFPNVRVAAVAAKQAGEAIVTWDILTGAAVTVPPDLASQLGDQLRAAGPGSRAYAVAFPDGAELHLDLQAPLCLVTQDGKEIDLNHGPGTGTKLAVASASATQLNKAVAVGVTNWRETSPKEIAEVDRDGYSSDYMIGAGGVLPTARLVAAPGTRVMSRFLPGSQSRILVEFTGAEMSLRNPPAGIVFLGDQGEVAAMWIGQGGSPASGSGRITAALTTQNWPKVRRIGLRTYQRSQTELGRSIKEPRETPQ